MNFNARRRQSGWMVNMALERSVCRSWTLADDALLRGCCMDLHYLNADGFLCNKKNDTRK